MNHENFDFTQIVDETNDMIFLKSPLKAMFLENYCPIGICSEKSSCVAQLYMAPNIRLGFIEK